MSKQARHIHPTDYDSVHVGLDRKLKMLESITRILSDRYDIQVVFSREGECKTSERLMILPYDPAVDEGLILGLAGHEIGHLIYTDFKVCEEIANSNVVDNRYLLYNITNALEDVRIEAAMEKKFPGFVDLFNRLTPYVQEYKESELPRLPALQKVLDVLFLKLRGYDSSWYEPEINYYVDDHLLLIGEQIHNAKSTKEVLSIAKQVYEIITNGAGTPIAQEVKEQANTGDAGGTKENLDGQLVSEIGELLAQSYNDGIVVRTGIEEKELERETEYVGGQPHGQSRLILADRVIKDLQEQAQDQELSRECRPFKNAVREIAIATVREAQKERVELGAEEYNVHPICLQEPHETEFDVAPGDIADYNALTNSVRREVAVVKKRLQQIVINDNFARWNGSADRGVRLNRKVLHKIPLGERNIFKRKSKDKAKDMAFTLLVDESGSMYGDKILQAQRCAVMCSETLDLLQIPFEVIGFSTCDITTRQRNQIRTMSPRHRDDLERQVWDRSDNLRHNMYKRFNEPFKRVRTRLVNIASKLSNYDQDHVEFAWNRLKSRPEARKVLIVISDSLPCGGPAARRKLKRLVNQIGRDKNAECIAIGIQAPHLEEFYHKHINIEDASQLGINVVRLIESAILKRKASKAVDEFKTTQSVITGE